ncbi:MAG: hypothetical protein PUA56_02830 [Bacillales bacterium]|nr:hypothetical protein [Bacillales bacterium]
MNKFINNFYSLYSNDDRVTYQAILEKKDWMFRPLFFMMTFEGIEVEGKIIYPDLFALMDKAIHFKKAEFHQSLFEDNLNKKDDIINGFNKSYRLRYAFENIVNISKKAAFFVEMDFSKIDKKSYNELVANFYPCISEVKDLDLFYNENSPIDLIKFAMYGENNSWVFILDINALINDRYYMNFMKKIWYNPSLLDDEMIETLKEISSTIEVPLEEYYGK